MWHRRLTSTNALVKALTASEKLLPTISPWHSFFLLIRPYKPSRPTRRTCATLMLSCAKLSLFLRQSRGRACFQRSKTYCKPVLDRKVDRNADTLQQTITDTGKHDPALGATGRTTTNSHGQSMPYPPSAPFYFVKSGVFICKFLKAVGGGFSLPFYASNCQKVIVASIIR
jgi:hypothetical protein